MIHNTFNKPDTLLWESDTPEGDALRKSWRDDARSASYALNGATIALYSYDDVLLDAINYGLGNTNV